MEEYKLEEKALTSPKNYGSIYPWVIKSFEGCFMFKLHLDTDLDTLFEKLTAQIGPWPRVRALTSFQGSPSPLGRYR